MHRSTAALVLAIALGSAGPLRADGMPWDADQALLKQAWSAMQSQGIQSVAPFAPRIEQALTDAQLTYRIGDTTYVLVDGVGEGMIASTVASSGKNASGTTVTIDSPYPMLGLLLGSYYDEIGKSDDAVRVIDLALSKHAVGGVDVGDMRPPLMVERGEALVQLKRVDEALKSFDGALAEKDLDPSLRAHALRGRGYALTELGRLDDAEAAYRESLKDEPGSATAKHELDYIARLKAGKTPTQGELTPLQKPKPSPAPVRRHIAECTHKSCAPPASSEARPARAKLRGPRPGFARLRALRRGRLRCCAA